MKIKTYTLPDGSEQLCSEPTTTFERNVVAAVYRIPSGRVASYTQPAVMAGYTRRHQQVVGNVISKGPRGPIHRVVREDGTWISHRLDGSEAWSLVDSEGRNEQQRALWLEGLDTDAAQPVPRNGYLTNAEVAALTVPLTTRKARQRSRPLGVPPTARRQ